MKIVTEIHLHLIISLPYILDKIISMLISLEFDVLLLHSFFWITWTIAGKVPCFILFDFVFIYSLFNDIKISLCFCKTDLQ